MVILLNSYKFSCQECLNGHRGKQCIHYERAANQQALSIRRRGKPPSNFNSMPPETQMGLKLISANVNDTENPICSVTKDYKFNCKGIDRLNENGTAHSCLGDPNRFTVYLDKYTSVCVPATKSDYDNRETISISNKDIDWRSSLRQALQQEINQHFRTNEPQFQILNHMNQPIVQNANISETPQRVIKNGSNTIPRRKPKKKKSRRKPKMKKSKRKQLKRHLRQRITGQSADRNLLRSIQQRETNTTNPNITSSKQTIASLEPDIPHNVNQQQLVSLTTSSNEYSVGNTQELSNEKSLVNSSSETNESLNNMVFETTSTEMFVNNNNNESNSLSINDDLTTFESPDDETAYNYDIQPFDNPQTDSQTYHDDDTCYSFYS